MAQIVKTQSAVPDTQVRSLVSGRSPGEGNGSPPQCSCLENSLDRGAWWATVHGVTEWTQLRDYVAMFLLCSQLCWLVPRLTLVDL